MLQLHRAHEEDGRRRGAGSPTDSSSRMGGADAYRLACQELQVEPAAALVDALEGLGGDGEDWEEEEGDDQWEEGQEDARARGITLRGLDEPHVCALAITLSHLQQQQQQQHQHQQQQQQLDKSSSVGLRLRLRLPECCPGREGMRQLGMALAESDAVVGLSFGPSPAVGEDEELLLLLLGELRHASSACALQRLSLAGSGPLTPRHLDALSSTLLALPHGLRFLDLSDTQLEPSSLVLLGRLLRGGTRGLVHLSLARNPRLGDEGAAVVGGALAARLPSGHTWGIRLQSLDLSHTDMGDEGLSRLVDGVAAFLDHHQQQQPPSSFPLRRLLLDGNNRLSAAGVARHLGQLLRLLVGGGPLHLSLARNALGAEEDDSSVSAALNALGDAAPGSLASLDVRDNALDAAALQALAGIVEGDKGLERLSLTLPPLPRQHEAEDAALQAALEGLLDAAASSPSLQRLGLEGPRGYLTDGVVAAIIRAERCFARNREAAAVAVATVAGVGVSAATGSAGGGEPSLSELVLSILFEEGGQPVGCGGGSKEKEDVATTVEILRGRLRGMEEAREREQLDAAILEKIMALLSPSAAEAALEVGGEGPRRPMSS